MFDSFKGFILRNVLKQLRDRGYYFAKPSWENPIPDKKYLLEHDGYWKKPYPCHGIEFNDEKQLSLCEELAEFAPEIYGLPKDVLDPEENKSFLDMDLEFLYCMIRLCKPKQFIEIGGGWTSLIAMHALAHNRKEGVNCRHILIEPYPRPYFVEHASFELADEFIKRPIQEVSLDYFKTMSANDIVFIDTSHIMKYGSDVNYLYFHIIPLIGSGCYVHIHDIFIPSDYPEYWIIQNDMFYSEQYLVMAFIMYNHDFQITLAAQYLSQKYHGKLESLFTRFEPNFSPGSLWLQRK